MNKTNVERKENFIQVVVWPGTELGNETSEGFEAWILETFNVRAQYLEEILTNPDPDNPDTGGRNDLFFAIHNEDIPKFALPKLRIGARWLEDIYLNGGGYLYPNRVAKYKCWDEKKK